MVLSDFFKNIFSKRNSREEEDTVHDVGVTGLPRLLDSFYHVYISYHELIL